MGKRMLTRTRGLLKNKKALTAGIGYTIGNILISGLSFLTIPIFTRLLTTSDFGLYNSYMAYVSIVLVVIGFGFNVSIKTANIEFDKRIDEYVSNIISMCLLFLMFFLAIVAIWGKGLSSYFGYSQSLLFVLLIQSTAAAILSIYNIRLSLDYSYKRYLLIAFSTSVGTIAASIFLILTLFRSEKYVGRILGGAIPSIAAAIIIVCLLFRKKRPTLKKDQIKFAMKLGVPIIPHGLSQILLSQFDRIMIQRMIGNAEAGIYSFSYTIAVIPQIIASSFDTVWGPWFFEQYRAKKIELIKMRSSQYVMLFSTIVVCIMAISPEIIHIMAPIDYWKSIYSVIPVILAMYFTFLYFLPAQIEYFEKRTINIAFGTVGAAAMNISLNLIFIPKYGYNAAAYITLITYVCNFIFHLYVAKKITGTLPFAGRKILVQIVTVCTSATLIRFAFGSLLLRFAIVVCAVIMLLVTDRTIISKGIDYIKAKNKN